MPGLRMYYIQRYGLQLAGQVNAQGSSNSEYSP